MATKAWTRALVVVAVMGDKAYERGGYEAALRSYREAAKLYRGALGGRPHADLVRCLDMMAGAACELARHREALDPLRQSLAIRRRIHKDDHPHVAARLN